jgi:hypothetical protein
MSRRELLHRGAAAAAITPLADRLGRASEAIFAPRNLLTQSCSPEKLKTALQSPEDFHPFAHIDERADWDGLPDDARQALIERGDTALKQPWDVLPATVFLDFARNGNRTRYEHIRDLRRGKLQALVLAECVENKGRFLDEIVNGIWLTSEETFWGVPAHMTLQKAGVGLPDVNEPVIDLFAAETSSLLAWTLYLLGSRLDTVSKLVRPRIETEVQRRILDPGLARTDFWWMGLDEQQRATHAVNNWNPWINSNWLTSSLIIEKNSDRRWQTVSKIMRSLDVFIDTYPDDGGCTEGPSYWGRAGASLFDCLELLRTATAGAIDLYSHPLIANMGRFIYRAHIYNDSYMNFGDAPAKVHSPGDLIYRYGARVHAPELTEFGAFAAMENGTGLPGNESLGRSLPALFGLKTIRGSRQSQALVRDVWLPDSQIMAARVEADSPRGFYLGVKGGVNGRSHGHNDAGNFLVFVDGLPVIIDVGVEAYTAQTFGPHRYDIWTMQSAYHNLPTIGDVMQKTGPTFAARSVSYSSTDTRAEIRMDLAGAYPAEAGLQSWIRTIQLNRQRNRVHLREAFELERPAPHITLSLMTPCAAQVDSPGVLRFPAKDPTGKDVLLHYDSGRLTPAVDPIEIKDAHLQESWGPRLYRVLLRAERPPTRDTWELEFQLG